MSSSNEVLLRWTGEGEIYSGTGKGGVEALIDGGGDVGPSPVETLLLALGACMAVDVQMILEKSRVPLNGLEVTVEAERASDPPRRVTALRLAYRVSGPAEEDRPKLERAVTLSREKYCSVLHSLQPDIDLKIEILPA